MQVGIQSHSAVRNHSPREQIQPIPQKSEASSKVIKKKLNERNQVVIPQEFLEQVNGKRGGYVEFSFSQEKNVIYVKPIQSARERFIGMLEGATDKTSLELKRETQKMDRAKELYHSK